MCYKNFIHMIWQFTHIKFMKYMGQGNVDNGIATTPPGGLTIVCLACPQPGINLLPNWQSAPPEMWWEKDPGLHTRLAYFINPRPYFKHVCKFATQKDMSTCSGFHTLAHTESKNLLVWPLAIGDLQKSEHYCNMDYIALSTAKSVLTDDILFSYDIACQWKINFFECMQVQAPTMIHFGIPKCHCKGHKAKLVGRTDGEGIERTWSEVNIMANSTKEMGSGYCYDKLDDQFARHNWHRLIRLGG
ncbi:hypothetical protein ARMGADRAFT_1048845 [Armillaria gallica]|uniref:CxC2-like cysteine cluster KDZ transposase-associated domain-containing protein n=1 Tax=Armillaria gallica TaxID=47427 RepID=A0A2H3CZ33_ARMGA|nr:hypothetical protein ARMGADRAFT_1048845 [Armillaria gallica]